MRIEKLAPIRTTLRDSDHPYLTGAWTPQHEEVTAHDLPVLEGAVPADLDGVYLRNTENQIHQPLGRYHPFDGDAMIHQLDFRRGQVELSQPLRAHALPRGRAGSGRLAVGRADGSAGHFAAARLRRAWQPEGFRPAPTSPFTPASRCRRSTSAARRTASIPRRWTRSASRAGRRSTACRRICKVDPHTGELMFFNYSKHAPYMHYGVVDRNGRLVTYQPIPLPGPRLPHDMAVTRAPFDPQRPAGVLGQRPARRGRARGAHARPAVALRRHPAARPHRRVALVRSGADVRPALPQRVRGGPRDRDGRLLPGESDAAPAARTRRPATAT